MNDKSHLWSDYQQETHDYIQSLHNSGLGYRKIAKRLNEEGIRTFKGKKKVLNKDNEDRVNLNGQSNPIHNC